MSNYNRVILAGRMTADPVMQKVGGQETSLTKFALAIGRKYKKGDEVVEETSFIDVEAWGRQAEIIADNFGKGRPILVEGRLKQSRWEDEEGNKRSKLLVHLENFTFIDSQKKENANEGGGGQVDSGSVPF